MWCEQTVYDLLTSCPSLFHDEDFSDLDIRSGGETLKVHKAVVCARSDFFKIACKKAAFKVWQAHELRSTHRGPRGTSPLYCGRQNTGLALASRVLVTSDERRENGS